MSDIDNILKDLQRFSWPDYVVFTSMLVLCIFIGIYFGFLKKSLSEDDYLMGGRKMLVVPIAFSLVASFISGITLLGLPTEVYSYGIQYLYVTGGVILMGVVMSVFYLPVFHNLNITSTYEYLQRRFDRRLRLFGSIMFTIMNGGIKAVVWTDVVQTVSMVGALVLVAVKGSFDRGGPSEVFSQAWNTHRIELPDFNPNPTVRHTIWSQIVGGVFYWTQTNAVSQNMIQRYLALPNLNAGLRALWIFIGGVILVMFLCSYNGLLIYATYKNCDPLTTQLVKARDQLLPLFVMDTFRELPGLSGLFIAGVFSAALSSLSTCLNSMSAVVLEDFVKPFVERPLSETAINWIMRTVVVGVGAICVGLVYVVEKMGTVLQLTMSLEAITNGPLFGIFTVGIFMPRINGNSILFGGIVGVIIMSWISLNAQWAIASGAMKFKTKQLSVDGCRYDYNHSLAVQPNDSLMLSPADDIFPLYRISYMWYTCLGALITMSLAYLFTFVWGGNDPRQIHPSLLTPCIRKKYKSVHSTNVVYYKNVPTSPLNAESTL